MSNSHKSGPERLDALVAWTGIRATTEVPGTARPRRWSSLAVILVATIVEGTSWLIDTTGFVTGALGTMSMLLIFGVVVREMGPLRSRRTDQTTDEREREWNNRSALMGFGVVAVIAMMGIGGTAVYLVTTSLHPTPAPQIVTIDPLPVAMRLMVLLQYLAVLLCVVPTLHASWTMPPPLEED